MYINNSFEWVAHGWRLVSTTVRFPGIKFNLFFSDLLFEQLSGVILGAVLLIIIAVANCFSSVIICILHYSLPFIFWVRLHLFALRYFSFKRSAWLKVNLNSPSHPSVLIFIILVILLVLIYLFSTVIRFLQCLGEIISWPHWGSYFRFSYGTK